MNIDKIVFKMDIDGDFIENEVYNVKIIASECEIIVALIEGVMVDYKHFFDLRSINGKVVYVIYKGKSRIDGKKIFSISPIQINREIKLNMIL